MASALYPLFKQALLNGDVNLPTDDVKAVLLDTADYTYDSTDEFLDDIAAGIVGTAVSLASKTIALGVFDAADTTLTSVTGDPSEAVLLYVDTGTDSTSRLVAFIDGVSVTPNGGNIVINWDNGANKIFAL